MSRLKRDPLRTEPAVGVSRVTLRRFAISVSQFASPAKIQGENHIQFLEGNIWARLKFLQARAELPCRDADYITEFSTFRSRGLAQRGFCIRSDADGDAKKPAV